MVESDHFKMQAGLGNFTMSTSEWIDKKMQSEIKQMSLLENLQENKLLK